MEIGDAKAHKIAVLEERNAGAEKMDLHGTDDVPKGAAERLKSVDEERARGYQPGSELIDNDMGWANLDELDSSLLLSAKDSPEEVDQMNITNEPELLQERRELELEIEKLKLEFYKVQRDVKLEGEKQQQIMKTRWELLNEHRGGLKDITDPKLAVSRMEEEIRNLRGSKHYHEYQPSSTLQILLDQLTTELQEQREMELKLLSAEPPYKLVKEGVRGDYEQNKIEIGRLEAELLKSEARRLEVQNVINKLRTTIAVLRSLCGVLGIGGK